MENLMQDPIIDTSDSYFVATKSGGCRSYVPEDDTHKLYSELFERFVHVPKARRNAVVKALAAIYEISL